MDSGPARDGRLGGVEGVVQGQGGGRCVRKKGEKGEEASRGGGAEGPRAAPTRESRGEGGRTSWVGDGLDVVDQLQIREVVHVDFVLQHNDDPVGNGSGTEGQTRNRFDQVVCTVLDTSLQAQRTYLSLRSLTARTSERNVSSPIHRF